MSGRRSLAVGALLGTLWTPGRLFAQAAERAGNPFDAADPAAPVTPAHRPAPFAALSASAVTMRDSLVALARAQIGRRYRTGGETPDKGFDCSGLVQYVMSALRVSVPRTASQQAHAGRPVDRDRNQLRPGDLVTFGFGKRISHIGIYVGDGRFVHASTKAGRVIESKLDRPPSRQIKPWRGVRRVIATGDSAAVAAAPRG